MTGAYYFYLAISVKDVEPPRFGWAVSMLGALAMILLPVVALRREREDRVAAIGASFGFLQG